MNAPLRSRLQPGQVLEIAFETFTAKVTFWPGCQMALEIVSGENTGFSDTIAFQSVPLREGLEMLTWQEHIGSTIVHVLDFDSGTAYTAVTPAKGGFMRLTGRINILSR